MRPRPKAIVVTGLFLFWTIPALGEVIDRIVSVVNDRFIITLSDIQKERARELALGTDTDLGKDDEVASWLVKKHLIEEQMAQYPPIEIPEEEIQERLREIKDSRGFSQEELRQAVIAKLRRREFMTQRFGPFIEVSDEELRTYYNDVYAPAVRREGLPVPSLEQSMNTVRQIVIAQKIGEDFDVWMTDLLRRTKVEKVSN
jgi:hypothetical protein